MSSVKKRSIRIGTHATSLSLEEPFWEALKKIAREQNLSLASLIKKIDDQEKINENLSSTLRVFVLRVLERKLKDAKAP